MTRLQLISFLCNHGYDEDDLKSCSSSELRELARDIPLDCVEFMEQDAGRRLGGNETLGDSVDNDEDSDEFE